MLRTLRHYQVDGVEWLTTPNVFVSKLDLMTHDTTKLSSSRHLLTDVPGAGKTFQATEAANRLMQPNQACCIIVPAHLAAQWFDFMKEQYPDDLTVWLEGPKYRKQQDAKVRARWYIISVQSLRHKHYYDLAAKLFIDHRVTVCIIDESHYVKNPDAKCSHYVRQLTRPDFCPHVVLLSATPIMKEASDLYHQLRICDPHTFHSMADFLNEYCYYTWTSWGPANVSLKKDAATRLKPWLWGRTYAEIGLELPPLSAYKPHIHAMCEPRRKAYDDIKKYWWTLINSADPDAPPTLNANSAMEVMHMLRHIISSPEKQQSLASFLNDDPGPYLIATFYRDSAKELASYIHQHHPDKHPIIITGEIEATERIRTAVNSKNPNDIVIATIPSISEGCDLSHCNTVYFYESDFTPGKMYQFLSRVRRHRNATGTVTIPEDRHLQIEPNANERPVIVRYFHADNSIDQRIHAVREQRAVNVRDLIKVELNA